MKATSAMVAIKKGKKILILKDSKRGRWTLPGGQIDKGETAKQGAAREVKEESGVKIKIQKKSCKTKKYNKGRKKAVVFSAKAKKAKVQLSHEHESFKWISPKKAIKKLINRHALAVLTLCV
jgi:8-oxo-dGTP pyrophosphatase MutT (NUDIX family)